MNNKLQGFSHGIIQLHNSGLIPAAITVIRCGKYRHNILVVTPEKQFIFKIRNQIKFTSIIKKIPIISFHCKLMSSRYQREIIRMFESLRDVLAESISSSSRIDTPSAPVIWIGPEQIAHWALYSFK